MTASERIDVRTDDGIAPCWVHAPAEGKHPGIIMYPDAGSVRPVAHEMAERLASAGYVVLLPHIFYRAGAYPSFDLKTVFGDPKERERLLGLVRSLDHASAMRDAAHYIRTLREQPGHSGGRIGTVGYCIGGRLAFTTAIAHAADVGAAASFHGGGVATSAADSPHREAAKIQASLYFGVADNDPSCTPEQQGQLVTALAAAHVDFTLEHYRGAAHGFAVPDFPVYDEACGERHWERMLTLFRRSLTPAG